MYNSIYEKGIYSFSGLWFISKYINWAQMKKITFSKER